MKTGPEYFLDLPDVLADARSGAGLRLDERRSREVIGMGMGFEHPLDSSTGFARAAARIASARADVGFARGEVEIEHRIDHRRAGRVSGSDTR